MFRLQRLAQQGIVAEVDHAGREVVACAPIGIHLVQFILRVRWGSLCEHWRSRSGRCHIGSPSVSALGRAVTTVLYREFVTFQERVASDRSPDTMYRVSNVMRSPTPG